jgi:hypothetical protein
LPITHFASRPPTEECDIVGESLPFPVQFALNREGTKRISEAEKVMGDKVASRLKDVWDLDEGGELNAVSNSYYLSRYN